VYYGTTLSLVRDGVRIPEQRLKPLGIFHQSLCWGVLVPDRHPPEHARRQPEQPGDYIEDFLEHLIIAPFDIDSWPALFRVELKLQQDRTGALSQATSELLKLGFNILGTHVTPSGHHHATFTAIGEADHIRHDPDFQGQWKALRNSLPRLRPDDEKIHNFVHQSFAPVMLAYSKRLEERILELHGRLGNTLLRVTFADDKPGVLYSARELADPLPVPEGNAPEWLTEIARIKVRIRTVGAEQSIPAVKCVWLKNLAFLALYRHRSVEPIRFRYNGERSLFEPVSHEDKEHFRQLLRSKTFQDPQTKAPVSKAIVGLDLEEHYLRIAMSRFDSFRKTAFVNIQYIATFVAPSNSSRGFQHEIYDKLSSQPLPFHIRRVSSGITDRSLAQEQGWLHLLLSSSDPERTLSASDLATVRGVIEQSGHGGYGDHASGDGARVLLEKIEVDYFRDRRVFLSTLFDWYREPDNGFIKECIEHLASTYGFELVVADLEGLPGDQRQQVLRNPPGLERMVRETIHNCEACLLLLPDAAFSNPERLLWIFYELGCAAGIHIPHHVCVQTDHHDIHSWQQKVGSHLDREVTCFRLEHGDATLKKDLTQAFQVLADVARHG
jgi:hypothetical protein